MNSDEKKIGCCNLIIWDFIIIAFVSIQFMIQQVRRPWLGILIGLAIAIIFIALFNVKYIGHILQVIAGLIWSWVVWDMFDVKNMDILEGDIVGQRVIAIGMGVFFVGAHFISKNNILGKRVSDNNLKNKTTSSRSESGDNSEILIDGKYITNFEVELNEFLALYKFAKKKNEECFHFILSNAPEVIPEKNIIEEFARKSNGLINDFNLKLDNINMIIKTNNHEHIRTYISKMKSLMHEILEIENQINEILRIAENRVAKERDSNKKDSSFNGFDPFAGCNNKESLTKRYKSLVKQFHPDVANGDTEQLQWLNNRYYELLNQLVD